MSGCGKEKKTTAPNKFQSDYMEVWGGTTVEEGDFRVINGLLYYIDFETMEGIPICNKPNCRHISWKEDRNTKCDETVFFQTLEQYQYNPAMIIAGEAGETINASAAGTVTAIEESAQTGLTVTLDMGNGYSAVYGQLKDVQVKTGDYVAAGSAIGSLNEPTKYYSVEGTNLYFQVLKDGEPVDPMNFME